MKKIKNLFYSGLAALTIISSCEKPEDDESILKPTLPDKENPTEKPPLYENAKDFDGSKLSEIYNYKDNKIYFSNPLSNSYVEGDIFGSEPTEKTPFGMNVKINSISSDRKSATVSPATLEDVFREGYFDFEEIISSENVDENLSKNLKSLEGVLLDYSNKSSNSWDLNYNFNDVIIYDADGNNSTKDDQTKLNGSLSIGLKAFLHTNFNEGISANAGIDSYGKAEIELTSDLGVSFSDEVTVWSKYFKPKTLWVSGFPIVLVPKISINVGADGEANSSLLTNASDEFTAYAKINFSGFGDWTFTKNYSNKFDFNPPELNASASARAYAELDFDLLVYGGPGVSSELESSILFNADINSNPWYDLNWRLNCNLGFDPGFLSVAKVPEFNKSIFSIEEEITQADGAFNQNNNSNLEGKIVFMSKSWSGGVYDICTINPDGSNKRVVKNNPLQGNSLYPRWNPIQEKIVYSKRSELGDWSFDIYEIGSYGADESPLIFSEVEELYPCFSPNGSILFFSTSPFGNNSPSEDNYNIYKKYLGDSIEPEKILGNPDYEYNGLNSSTSDERLVFSSEKDVSGSAIYTMDYEGNILEKITSGEMNDMNPSFSPDGNYIVFSSQRNGNFDLFITDSYGDMQEKNITKTLNIDEVEPSFSPDGTKIVFTSDESGNKDIYIIDVDGSNRTRLTNTSSSSYPTWK
jgi:TolB protein